MKWRLKKPLSGSDPYREITLRVLSEHSRELATTLEAKALKVEYKDFPEMANQWVNTVWLLSVMQFGKADSIFVQQRLAHQDINLLRKLHQAMKSS